MGRVGLRLGVLLIAVSSSIGISAASAEPIAVRSGSFALPWDDPASFRLSGPDGLDLSGLFSLVRTSPQSFCIAGCRPGTTVNLSTEAGGLWPTERFSLGSTTGAMVDGKRIYEPRGLGPESPRLAGTLRFDAESIVLPPVPNTFSASFQLPFTMTGDVKGYAPTDIDGSVPLFDITVAGRGVATVRFDVIGDMYGNVSADYTLSSPADPSPVPEPTSMILLGMPVAGLVARAVRRRRRTTERKA